jgi:uncharacterized protein (TIGR03435 family)
MQKLTVVWLLSGGSLCVSGLDAQPAFEVASVKPSAQGGAVRCGGGPGSADPTLFSCHGLSLTAYLLRAFDLQSYQLIGPDWLHSARFDVQARVPAGATREQFRAMLQDLLATRFKLATRREDRELGVYVLKAGAKHKLKEWVEPAAGQPRAVSGAGGAPDGAAVRRMAGWGMELIVLWFSASLDRPVLAETGLVGKYDVTLTYFPDAPAGGDGPSLMQAIREQLGLTLEPAKRKIPVLVIDHIEPTPAEN